MHMSQVVGIDPDKKRLQLARKKYPGPNLTYQDGTEVDIPGGDYDIVFSNSVLHWCENKERVFKQIKKSLKKGGKFGFVTPTNFSPAKQFCTPADMVSAECRQGLINTTYIPSTEELQNIIGVTGFQITYMHEHIREWKFEGVSKLIEFLMTHYNEYGRQHYNAEAMKRRYGDGEIVINIPYTTATLVT